MKLLLHACCGPCAIYPIQYFKQQGIDVTCYYFNPNIHPIDEHMKRGQALQQVCDAYGVQLVYSCEFEQQEWEQFECEEFNERCDMCYRVRLEEVVRYARRNGFDTFSTSLLISPYQAHERIANLCNSLADESSVDFKYVDFRKNFREGQKLAREMNIYMQKYCGCICSKNGNGR